MQSHGFSIISSHLQTLKEAYSDSMDLLDCTMESRGTTEEAFRACASNFRTSVS